MKRIALILLALLTVLSLFVSCQKQPEKVESGEKELVIAENGKCNFKVIYPDKATAAEKNSATYIKNILLHYSGANVEIATDWSKDPNEDHDDVSEILVGNTNRSASKNALDCDYIAKVDGNKIVLNGKDEKSLYLAVGIFATQYIKNTENSTVKIPSDLALEGVNANKDGWMLYAIPAFDAAKPLDYSKSVTDAVDLSSSKEFKEYATVQYFSGVDQNAIKAYVEYLEGMGFVLNSQIDNDQMYCVSLFCAPAGRENRFTLMLNKDNGQFSISQIVPFDQKAQG